MRGLVNLASGLTPRELVMLRRAITRVEDYGSQKETFEKLAKKHGVTTGDLEQAFWIRLPVNVQRELKARKIQFKAEWEKRK